MVGLLPPCLLFPTFYTIRAKNVQNMPSLKKLGILLYYKNIIAVNFRGGDMR